MKHKNLFFSITFISFVRLVQLLPAMDRKIDEVLFLMCEQGYRVDQVDLLITQGANINAEDEFKWRPLHIACEYGHLDIVKFLLGKGADINFRMRGFTTPLHCAVIGQHAHIVRYLLDMGADEDILNRKGLTALQLACLCKNQAIVELFPESSSEETKFCNELCGDNVVNVTC